MTGLPMTSKLKTLSRISRPAAKFGLAVALAVSTLPAEAANRGSVDHRADYTITLTGFPIARASFVTDINGAKFEIHGHFSTMGLAWLVRRVEGTANVSGRVAGEALIGQDYHSRYISGNSKKSFDVSFAHGGVRSYQAKPERKSFPHGWIKLTNADLRRAVDPVSGLILPASAKLCQGTIPIFDGEARMDFQLTDIGERPYRAGKYKLDAHVCGLRVSPKSGFRKNSADMGYLGKIKGMEIWFAKSPVANVYAPVKIKAPTKFGSVVIRATRFGA